MVELVYNIPYKKVVERKNEILNWHPDVADEEEKQIEKFVGIDSVKWFFLMDDDKLVSVAGMVEYDDNIYLNQIWAKSGYGKKMVDSIYNYYKNNSKITAEKFTFSAHNPKVIDHYKTKFTEYKFVGDNKWGFPTFERKF